ncbi:MAG TPA: carboxypeptidase-like regulatory domain-containing protein, partial [Niabella sp.]|nr:carboxypeptidase-like regulatory domain-containing protein [Niabella sp.]
MKEKILLSLFLSCLFWLHQTSAQNIVTGRITDALSNEPLKGATIKDRYSAVTVFSDENGLYSIAVSSDTTTLIFSYVGYQSQEMNVSGKRQLDVGLLIGDADLSEVVVVGYGSQKKINLTGAVSTVQSKELLKVPSSNVSEVLIGKAPGLFTKQNSGVPGSDYANLSIRGYDAPLILVDGIETSWTRMDPNEIESISVLK